MDGAWGILLAYDVGLVLVVRLLHFAIDPESSWSAAAARGAKRLLKRLHDRFERPRGRPIEVIARDVRDLGHRLHTVEVSPAEAPEVAEGYDAALAEACAALDVVHLLDLLEPGPERTAERHRVEERLAVAGLSLEQAG